MGAPDNPFWYGREVGALVGRDADVAATVHTLTNAERLFLLAPRRFGKTSVLEVAASEVAAHGMAVLRYDAESYDTIPLLARAMATEATQLFAASPDRGGEIARRFFHTLRPAASFDLSDQRLTVDFDLTPEQRRHPAVVLADVLEGIEQLADTHGRPTAVILDEFQEILIEGGDRAADHLRRAVESHRFVGYAFASSRARTITGVTGPPSGPFWKLGPTRVLGPVPRADFRPFVRRGLESASAMVDDDAIDHIFELAEDVPYNVQWLSSACRDAVRLGHAHTSAHAPAITTATVDAVLEQLVNDGHAMYAQTWINLTNAQRRTLRAIADERANESGDERGDDFRLTEVAGAHGLPPSTMQRTLVALEERSLIRYIASPTGTRWSLGDPFFAHWLARAQMPA